MTRAYVPPWTEFVPCAGCGTQRPITARHRNFFDRAARRLCHSCTGKRVNPKREFVNGPSRPAALKYQPDETVVDWVVVDRLMSGQRIDSTRAERVAAVAALTALGMPSAAIAERMNVTQRTVVRLRVVVRQEVMQVA